MTNVRVNISMNPRIREMGDALASEDHRGCLSNEIEWLIEQEYRRRRTGLDEPSVRDTDPLPAAAKEGEVAA
jgi:hypothetical protein